MSTYKNCYNLVESCRRRLNEYSAAKVQGSDTVGFYSNEIIVEKINEVIRELYGMIARRVPELFLEEDYTITAANSVLTLPWNFGRLILLRDKNGNRVYPIQQTERRLVGSQGRKRLYNRVGNTLKLDRGGQSDNYLLTYLKKPRNIHHGQASAGAATSITLDSSYAPKIADYFNGMIIENVTQDWVDEIDDYSAARVATISETGAEDDYYGIVPEIPEWSHNLIAQGATYYTALESPVGQKRPRMSEHDEWMGRVRNTLVEFAAPSGDIDWEELFTSFEPNVPPGIGIIVD